MLKAEDQRLNAKVLTAPFLFQPLAFSLQPLFLSLSSGSAAACDVHHVRRSLLRGLPRQLVAP
jgi:hypothetical protein